MAPERGFSGEHIFERGHQELSHVVGMRARAQQGAGHLVAGDAEMVLNAGADEREALLGVDHADDVGKTGDQPAHEFLFVVQALFHFYARGDVHDSALQTHDLAGSIANDVGRDQAGNHRAVFLAQPHRQHRAPSCCRRDAPTGGRGRRVRRRARECGR
jgi:hypothetical protein